NDRYTLSIANKIYVQKDFTIKRDFARAATEVFDADVENIDFIQKRRAAGRMNAWVENQTNNKIKNLISPDILDEYTKTILINAIYFQGNWSNKFLNRLTEKKNFYKTNQDVVQVDTMHQYRQWFNYYQSPHLNAKFLEMPFVGRDVSMVFVLPNERGGLATLENQIENVFAPQPLRRSFLNIQLPKFKIETTLSLVNVLKNLGINKAFDEYEADLSGIAGRKGDLHISDVLQKTYVDIEEGGVEAAGATYVRVSPLLSLDFDPEESEPEEFVADHPFLFYIKAKTFIIFAGKNFLTSPYSVETVLALLHSGCKGETAQEIRSSLHLPDDKSKMESGIKESLSVLKGNDEYKFHTANKIYIKDGVGIKEEFKKAATQIYKADVENVNFAESSKAAKTMNDWVEKQTNNKIKDLISSKALNEDTRAILINAIYFKGQWTEEFDKGSTKKNDFYKTKNDVIKVDTMHQYKTRFGYYENSELKAKFLEMPFEGGDISMVIVLPDEREGLASLEKQTEKVFAPQNLSRELVDVALPKFRVESTLELTRILKDLGVKKAFEAERADLSGIAGEKGDLIISEAVQKTYIDVAERGVEAAAATYINMIAGASPVFRKEPEPKKFIADHPFIFYVKVRSFIVFAGRVSSPH
ncbi:Serpin domain containing protein, partial [Asbolus verrucosus]